MYEQYDTVILKDGRRGCIVEKFSETNFQVDVGSSEEDWDSIFITAKDILKQIDSSTPLD